MSASIRRIDGSNAFTAALFNELVTEVESLLAKVTGRGILSGLALTDDGGFTLGIGSGFVSNGLRIIEVVSPLTQAIPSSVTRYVWLTPDTLAISLTATSADPGGNTVPLGKVISDGSGITSVDMGDASGRVEAARFTDLRTFKLGGVIELDVLNGRLGIGKTPAVLFDVDGEFAASQVTTPLGVVSVLRLPQSGSSPSAPADAALIYSKNVGSTAEIHFMGEGGGETQFTRAGRPRAIAVLYRQMSVEATDTRANSTSELGFASKLSIAADTLRAEQTMRITARGVYGSALLSPGTLTIKLKYGSIVLASAVVTLAVNQANRGWSLDVDSVIRSVGASGTIEAQGFLKISSLGLVSEIYDLENTGPITIDTTATSDLALTVQFSAADAANTITQRLLIVEGSLD